MRSTEVSARKQKRELVGIFQGGKFDVDILCFPSQLIPADSAHFLDIGDGDASEHGICAERDEVFPIIDQKPESVPLDGSDFTG